MQVAVISDTHIDSRATSIPDWVREEIRAADHTIHAGDFDSKAALEEVESLADGALTAVSGNMDPGALGLPLATTVELEGVEFVVTHGTGPTHNYEQRVAEIVTDERSDPSAVGVSGHTHSVLDDTVSGVRLLNPGSATGAEPAEEVTMLRATVSEGALDVQLRRT